jgi:hypothetical protein
MPFCFSPGAVFVEISFVFIKILFFEADGVVGANCGSVPSVVSCDEGL